MHIGKTPSASYYCIITWICLVGSSIFTVSDTFMDTVSYPKWIITATLFIIFIFFLLPYFVLSKGIYWRLTYKQICRYTNILVLFETLIVISKYAGLHILYHQCQAGTFNNVAGLVACLGVSFPIGFIFFREYHIYECILFVITKFLSFLVLVICGSRIGCICIIILTILICFENYRYKKHFAIILGIISILFCTCFLKTPSTMGRWFIVERTMELILQRPFLGWGDGGFTREYMNVQADYFAAHSESQYEILADNIHHPLNEFLLIAVNYGLLCLFITIFMCLGVFLYYKFHKTPYGKEGCLVFLSIIVIASFSYPLSYPFTWLMLTLSIVLVFSTAISHIKSRSSIVLFVMTFLIADSFTFVYLKNELDFQLSWKRVAQNMHMQPFEEIKKNYDALYQCKHSNYHFLYDYACEAYDKEQYELALRLSKETEKFIADYELEMLIGDCYQSLDSVDQAIQSYQYAHYMCPSRLMPLYETYNIYSSLNDTLKCRRLYYQIIHKDIKVRNHITEIIQKEINQDFKRFLN